MNWSRNTNRIFKSVLCFGLFLLFQQSVDAQSGVWTWMHGSSFSGDPGNYGEKGVTAPSNAPPAKYQAAHWQDRKGNFWMFGGNGVAGNQNDMWKFDPKINQWTWMHGPSTPFDNGEFGTKGVPSPTNVPPANGYGSATWYDGLNGLYMYGGFAFGGGMGTNLWKYNIKTNEWVWLAGEGNIQTLIDYGTMGVASATNSPGYRAECESSWFRNDTLWLFGGQCTQEGDQSFYSCSDVWAFDLGTSLWTWMNEPKGYSPTGVPGNLGEHHPDNYPGGRMSFTNWLTDSALYVYSGMHNLGGVSRTDLWQYKFDGNTWAWLDGSQNMLGAIWDEYCDTDLMDNPGSKVEHHTVQTQFECQDIFWLFGGVASFNNTQFKNDLWAYIPSQSLWKLVWGNPTNAEFQNFGEKEVPSISNVIPARSGACIWTDSLDNIWVYGGFRNGFTETGADMWRFEVDNSCFDFDSTQCCTLNVDIRLGNVSSDSLDNGTISINVFDGEGDIEYSIDGGATWQDDNFFQDLPAGDYLVIVRDETGCTYEGVVTILDFNTSTLGLANDLHVEVYPNPTSDILYYAIGSRDADRVQVFTVKGNEMHCRKADRRVEIIDLPAGTYFLRIVSEGKSGVVKFQKI